MAGLIGKACRGHMLLPGDDLGLRPPLSGGRSKTEFSNFSIPENGLSYLFQSLLPSLSALPSLTTGSTALSLAEAEGSRYPGSREGITAAVADKGNRIAFSSVRKVFWARLVC